MSAATLKAIARKAKGFRAEIGLVLGSGMGEFAAKVVDPIVFPYADLPGFEQSGVSGHAGRLVLGHIGRKAVAVLQGRVATDCCHSCRSGSNDRNRPIAAVGKDVIVSE